MGEYAGSVYTKLLKGANAKAKANAVQVLPEMIEIASNGIFEINRKGKQMDHLDVTAAHYDKKYQIYRYN